MQEQFCSFRIFSQRTDALASALGLNLNELPEKIGISQRSLYGYRSGKYPVTAKALRKLREAEATAGIIPSATDCENSNAESSPNLKESPGVYKRGPDLEGRIAAIEIDIRLIKEMMATLLAASRPPPDPPAPPARQRSGQTLYTEAML